MITDTKVEWAWEDPFCEYYAVGFRTKEEVVEHVRWTANAEGWERPRKINIGHSVWPEPGQYASMDAGDLAGQIDENAFDDGCYTDDEPLFDFDDQKKAQEELITFLRGWANRHLKPCKWTFKKVEEIEIGAEKAEDTDRIPLDNVWIFVDGGKSINAWDVTLVRFKAELVDCERRKLYHAFCKAKEFRLLLDRAIQDMAKALEPGRTDLGSSPVVFDPTDLR